MPEFVPIFRLPAEAELEGWAEIVQRDPFHWLEIPGSHSGPNPFVYGTVRFLADPPDRVVGRVFRIANIRPSPPPLGETGLTEIDREAEHEALDRDEESHESDPFFEEPA